MTHSPPRPNLLLITSDQQHWMTLGMLNPEIRTPNLDRLAAAGMLCTRAYCPNPTCTPTRASILTGQYPSQHGAYSLGTMLPESAPTMNDELHRAGYRTGLVGKAHFQPLFSRGPYRSLEAYPVLQDLDFWRSFHGPWYGFDHIEVARNHVDEAHVGQHYALWMEANGLKNWRDFFQPPTGTATGQKHTWPIPEEFHYNRWIADQSAAFLDEAAASGRPFFLWSSFFDPHPGYLVPEPWASMYDPGSITVPEVTPGEHDDSPPHLQMTQAPHPDFSAWRGSSGHGLHGMHPHRIDRDALAKDIAIYYGMVSCLDHYVGKILDHLDAAGLAESTLVVFASDHGHFFGQHGLKAKGPFHYEDMIRVPQIVRQPGTVPAGARSGALQSLVDLPVSFLSHAGLDVPGRMTGVDQTPVWRGEAEAVRDHVLVENLHEPPTVHLRTYVDARYKLTVYRGHPYGELYDLEADPGEIRNLWDVPEAREVKARLLERFVQAELAREPVPMPRIAGA